MVLEEGADDDDGEDGGEAYVEGAGVVGGGDEGADVAFEVGGVEVEGGAA